MPIFADQLAPLTADERMSLYSEARHGYTVACSHDRSVSRPNIFNAPSEPRGTSCEFADWNVAGIMAGIHDANVIAGRFIARTSDRDAQARIEQAIELRRSELTA